MKKPIFFIITFLIVNLNNNSYAGSLIQIDKDLRQHLEVLNTKGIINLDLTTWPVSSEAITSALSQAKPITEEDRKQVKQIAQLIDTTSNSHVQLVANINGDEQANVSGFGKNYNTVTPFGFTASHHQANDKFEYQIQATLNANDDTPDKFSKFDGSYLGGKIGNQRLAFGSIPVWWGNGLDGSLIRSNAARPVTGLLLQRAQPDPIKLPIVSYLGNINYQLTAGQLQSYQAVPHAKLIGMRVSIQPNPALQIGASRSIMWGGKGRDENLKSLGKALTGHYDNGTDGKDPSNQLAGIDLQLNMKPLINLPASIYAQTVGEDEAGGLPSKKSYLAGVKGVVSLGQHDWLWHTEWANTYVDLDRENLMYTHSVYKDGYYQKGLPLGHPIGGDGRVISIGLAGAINNTNMLAFNFANANVNQSSQTINAAFPTKQRLNILETNWQHQYNEHTKFKVGLWGKHDSEQGKSHLGGNVMVDYNF